MKPAHPGFRRLRNSCDICTLSKLKCSREKPVCQRCVIRGCQQDCNYSVARRPGRRRQTSIVSEDRGSHGLDADATGSRIEQPTAPPTPSSSFVDSLLSIEKRHGLTRNIHQQRKSEDGRDRHMTTTSPGTSLTESFTNIPMELAPGSEAASFEAIDDLSLWEWGEDVVDTDSTNNHYSGSMKHLWDIPSEQAMLSGSEFGIINRTEESRNESLTGNNGSSQDLCKDNQSLLTPASGLAKDSSSSGLAAPDFIFDLSRNLDCKCPSQIGQLIYLISLRRASPTPVDVIFAVEQQLHQTKDAISRCVDCSLSSPYMKMMLCTTMSWVIEHLGIYIREASTTNSHKGQVTYLTIGGLTLSKEMSHSCFEALVKLRLRRVVQTARELAAFNMETKGTLLHSVQSAASETNAAAQRMFGMLELRSAV